MKNNRKELICRILAATSFGLFASTGHAAIDKEKMCKLQTAQPEYISWLPETPSYFAKVSLEGDRAFFIGHGNRVINLKEKSLDKRTKGIPGDIDPVPCSDGKILTIPGIALYSTAEVLSKGVDAEPLIVDEQLPGVYQSCAILKKRGNKTTYRIITDDDSSVPYRDYEVTYRRGRRPVARALRSGRGLLCPGKDLKTLLISKKGNYVSGFNQATGTTQIYHVAGGGCNLAMDLGYPTGKVEFSFDESQIVFHVDYLQVGQAGGYFSGVAGDMSKDVYMLDLTPLDGGERLVSGNLRRMSIAEIKGSGSYYPSFTEKGKVVFLNDDNNFYSFKEMDPQKVPTFEFSLPSADQAPDQSAPGLPENWRSRLTIAGVIGTLWTDECKTAEDNKEISAVEATSFFLGLSQESCKTLVEEKWSDEIASRFVQSHVRFSRDPNRFDSRLIGRLKSSILTNACSKLKPQVSAGISPPEEFGDKLSAELDGPQVLHHYCVGCHTPGGGVGDFKFIDELQGLSFGDNGVVSSEDKDKLKGYASKLKEARRRIDLPKSDGQAMPMGSPMEEGNKHKQILRDYLECNYKLATLPIDDDNYPYACSYEEEPF